MFSGNSNSNSNDTSTRKNISQLKHQFLSANLPVSRHDSEEYLGELLDDIQNTDYYLVNILDLIDRVQTATPFTEKKVSSREMRQRLKALGLDVSSDDDHDFLKLRLQVALYLSNTFRDLHVDK